MGFPGRKSTDLTPHKYPLKATKPNPVPPVKAIKNGPRVTPLSSIYREDFQVGGSVPAMIRKELRRSNSSPTVRLAEPTGWQAGSGYGAQGRPPEYWSHCFGHPVPAFGSRAWASS